ncbi:hypothetical protein [Primorskyibacter sp. 2E233]|uniref:hypothetical protein n=1 Tax=Primorskyibacter sp. 2E233 TaxID=3413431 RepID=UPI003BF364F6
MSAKFITGVLTIAATIAAFSAAPARAGNDDEIAKIVAGVATLYIAGQLINELSDNGAIVQVHGPGDRYDDRRYGHQGGKWKGGKWQGHRFNKVLPGSCVRKIQKRHTRFVLPRHCLRRNNVALRHLPQRCEINWRGNRGMRTGYALRCLKRNGYQIARRW